MRGRDRPVTSASYLLARLARFFLALGVKGCGGVFSKRRSTSVSLGCGFGFAFMVGV